MIRSFASPPSLIFSVVLLGLSALTKAQSLGGDQMCFSLERSKLSSPLCVPSNAEHCHSGQPFNCEIVGARVDCHMFSGVGTFKKPVDSFSDNFECSAYSDQICTGSGESQVCAPGPCLFYKPPFCRVKCSPCYKNPYVNKLPISGCKRFCKEKYCDDEPACSLDCNPDDPTCAAKINNVCSQEATKVVNGVTYILPRRQYPECKADVVCPNSLPPPTQFGSATCCLQMGPNNTCQVPCQTTGSGNIVIPVEDNETCEPPDLSPYPGGSTNDSCPWIDRPQNRITNVEPKICPAVEPGNRFPQDCCVCTNGQNTPEGKPCKACGSITQERCSRP